MTIADQRTNMLKESSPFGQRADQIEISQYFDNLEMPKIDEQGRILTLNKKGFMKVGLDHISQAFVTASKKVKLPLLEIGSAYGAASIAALKNGATVIANDLEIKHLLLLKKQVDKKYLPNLFLNNRYFPTETNLPNNSVENILCCRVAHFLNPQEIEIALDKIYNWLAPKGRLYFVIVSPYHHRVRWFLATYKHRLAQGDPWPGVVGNMEQSWPELINDVPEKIHVMDEKPILPALRKRGFNIESSELFDYGVVSSDSDRDGREYLGLIAQKK